MKITELLYVLALRQIPGIGDVLAKNLMAYCGSAQAVFQAKKSELLKIPQIGEYAVNLIWQHRSDLEIFKRAEEEIGFIEKHQIQPLLYTQAAYPNKLKYCHDAPIVLFYKGNADLNKEKIVAVIGTRNATDYGRSQTEKFIAGLSAENILIISGLAYGIDICAHRAALDQKMNTVAVLGHGLNTLYPAVHAGTAKKMLHQGGLISEFMSQTKPDKENFPKRNRIVAGMSDAVVVIESKQSGGALITAEIAHSYNRDVFAFPGRAEEEFSAGCNMLIKRNKAALVENAADLLFAMGWEETNNKTAKNKQLILPISLSAEETAIMDLLKEIQTLHIDEICLRLRLTPGKASGLLLQLEFGNLVKSLPGKRYTLN